MKPNQERENDESLHRVLRQWTVEASLPPRFGEQVWQRVARAEAKPKTTLWADFMRLVEVALPRPKIALSYVATLLVLGMTAGAVAAQIKTSHLGATLSTRYVLSVNPYQAEASQP